MDAVIKEFAIIETGSKQYRVSKNDIIIIERIESEENGIEFSPLLAQDEKSNIYIGSPYVENVKVVGEVLGEEKGPKVIAYKYKRRKNERKKIGHRQKYTKVRITEIRFS